MKSAITVKHVSKDFVLPHEQKQSVKSLFTSMLKSKNTYEMQHALKGVSFDIKQGEFFGILGRNGSGKSTLLKMLAGIYTPTKGEVKVTGKLVPFIELGVGFNPELTGRENVYLNGALLGFSKDEIDQHYDRIVAFAELEAFMDQKLKNYSSGMQVRLAFSVAIIAEADILLVDEVLAVGDADFQRKCFQYFKSLKKNDKTVVFVSHDMNAVREYCDRAILINDGKITHEGKANDVANEYLRLFNPSSEANDDKTEDRRRWGDHRVRFDTVRSRVEGGTVMIDMAFTAKEDIDDVVVGFRVKDSTGRVLTGANTIQGDKGFLKLKARKKKSLHWQLPNIFGNGLFTIDATIRLSDGVTICDNWDEVTSFSVSRNENLPYAIVPDVDYSVEDSK